MQYFIHSQHFQISSAHTDSQSEFQVSSATFLKHTVLVLGHTHTVLMDLLSSSTAPMSANKGMNAEYFGNLETITIIVNAVKLLLINLNGQG